jgi:hypothetical protein
MELKYFHVSGNDIEALRYFAAVNIRVWIQCSYVGGYQRFGGKQCLHLQGRNK